MGVENKTLTNLDSNNDNIIDADELYAKMNQYSEKGIAYMVKQLGTIDQNDQLLASLQSTIKQLYNGIDVYVNLSEDEEIKVRYMYEKLIQGQTDTTLEQAISNNINISNFFSSSDIQRLNEMGITEEVLSKNFDILMLAFGEDTIQAIKKLPNTFIEFSDLIKNIQISQENGIKLGTQWYFNNYKIISSDEIDFLRINPELSQRVINRFILEKLTPGEYKNLNNEGRELLKLSNQINCISWQSIKQLKGNGFSLIEIKELVEGLKGLYTYKEVLTELINKKLSLSEITERIDLFRDINAPSHYLVELIKADFPFNELFSLGYSKEEVCSVLSGIKGNGDIYDNRKFNIYHLVILYNRSKYKIEDSNGEKLPLNNFSLGDIFEIVKHLDNSNRGYSYIKQMKPEETNNGIESNSKHKSTILDQYPSIKFLYLLENYEDKQIKPYLDLVQSLDTKFNGSNIEEVIQNNIPHETIGQFLQINPNLSSRAMILLQESGFQFFSEDNQLHKSNVSFLENNKNLSTGKLVQLYKGIRDDKILSELIFNDSIMKEDILTMSLGLRISIIDAVKILEKGTTLDEVLKLDTTLPKNKKLYDHQKANIALSGISSDQFIEINKTGNEIGQINSLNLVKIINLGIRPGNELNSFLLSLKPYISGAYVDGEYGDHAFNVLLNELFSQENFIKVFSYLVQHKDASLKIGEKNVKINGKIQMLHGLLVHINTNLGGKISDMPTVLDNYAMSLNDFIEVRSNVDKVIYLGANQYYGEDHNGALSKSKSLLEKQYPGKIDDYSTGSELSKAITNPDDFINKLSEQLIQNKDKKVMLYIGLHGGSDGSAQFSKGGDFQNIHFKEIRAIASENPNLQIIINSCNSLYKFDDNNNGKIDSQEFKGNITINSGGSVSYSNNILLGNDSYARGETGQLKGDYNNDGKVSPGESNMYARLNYNHSFYLDSFYKKDGVNVIMDNKMMINM
ncbi:MAG: hypothetical protein GY828_02290 [Candidatus Gracilibacteria bacterium]|nr:hypothetical protein [Candidatus Gracilibacteria bacterium]